MRLQELESLNPGLVTTSQRFQATTSICMLADGPCLDEVSHIPWAVPVIVSRTLGPSSMTGDYRVATLAMAVDWPPLWLVSSWDRCLFPLKPAQPVLSLMFTLFLFWHLSLLYSVTRCVKEAWRPVRRLKIGVSDRLAIGFSTIASSGRYISCHQDVYEPLGSVGVER